MFRLNNEKLWIKSVLSLLITISFGIQLYYIFMQGDRFILGSFTKMDNDDVRYIRTAKVLLEKGMLVDNDVNAPAVNMMPGHPLVLAGIFKMFGDTHGITAFRVFQAILQSLCLLLLFLIARMVFNSITGVLACIIDTFYVPEISATGLVLTEIEYKFFVLLLIYISLHAVNTKSIPLYIWAGISWGAACLFRPTIALFPVAILFMWIVHKYSFKESLKISLIVTSIFCIILLPWWIRNYLAFDRFIPLSLASGNPFLQGTYLNYDQDSNVTRYTASGNQVKNDNIELEVGKFRLLTYFKENPLEYTYWYTIGKSWHLWRKPFYWKEVLGVSAVEAKKYHDTILVLSLIGLLMSIRRNRNALFIFSVILYFDFIHLPFFTFSRYAFPVMPLVIAFSAHALLTIALSKTSTNLGNRFLHLTSRLKHSFWG